MATAPRNNPPARPAAAPAYTSPVVKRPVTAPAVPRGNQTFLFDRSNYIWMLAGLACILIGFMLMAGGKSPDPHQFLYNEIYSARRITLAPIVILIGFGLEAYAIMKRPVRRDEVVTDKV